MHCYDMHIVYRHLSVVLRYILYLFKIIGACITQCPSISVLTITNGIRKCLKCLIGCINCDKGIN